MNFQHVVRRLHLYLGMFLLPWFFIYGVSSVVFSHPTLLGKYYGPSQWSVRFERPYDIAIPPNADMREIGARILKDTGLKARAFGTYRPNNRQLNVYVYDFWTATQIRYFTEEKRLVAEDKKFRWDHFLTGMHARGGFQQDSFLNDAWAVTVDVVCVGILLWIATGVYMWWLLQSARWWGALALGGGVVSFVVFLLAL